MLTPQISAVFVAGALLWAGQGTPTPSLSPADIAQAIKDGMDGKKVQGACYALPSVEPKGDTHEKTEMDVAAEGPIGRIMRAAHEAKARHSSFSAADVTPDMAAPTLLVHAAVKWFMPDAAPAVSPEAPSFRATMNGIPVPQLLTPAGLVAPFFQDTQILLEDQLLFDLAVVQANPQADLQIIGTDRNDRWIWRCSIGASTKMKLK